MKFRFYITDLFEGAIVGTDSKTVAKCFAESEDHFVVDSHTGVWLQPDDGKVEVTEADSPEL